MSNFLCGNGLNVTIQSSPFAADLSCLLIQPILIVRLSRLYSFSQVIEAKFLLHFNCIRRLYSQSHQLMAQLFPSHASIQRENLIKPMSYLLHQLHQASTLLHTPCLLSLLSLLEPFPWRRVKGQGGPPVSVMWLNAGHGLTERNQYWLKLPFPGCLFQ